MKIRTTNLFVMLLIVLVFFTACGNTNRITDDKKLDEKTIRNMIDSFKFIFIAQHVTPATGGGRALSSGYHISVSKDSVISVLPFFGRGYIAPVSPAEVDLDFTSTKFTHTTSQLRKGWNISISPKDQHYLLQLYFRIFENGSASLNITSIDRSAISYTGYIANH